MTVRVRSVVMHMRTVVAALLSLNAIVLSVVSFRWPIVHDIALMDYIAWNISRGVAPYRDILDFNLPGTYLLHSVMWWLFEDNQILTRIFDLGLLGLIAVFTYRLLRPFGRSSALIGAALFPCFVLGRGPNDALQRDTLVTLCLVVGVVYFQHWGKALQSRHYVSRRALALLTGGLLGWGTLVKPSVALVLTFLVVVSAVRSRWDRAAGLVVGACVMIAALLSWISSLGGFEGLVEVQSYNLRFYSRIFSLADGMHNLSVFFYSVEPFLLICLVCVVILVADRLRNRAKKTRGRREEFAIALSVMFGIFHFSFQRRGSTYHFFPLIWSIFVLLSALLGQVRTYRKAGLAICVLCSLLIGVVGSWRTFNNVGWDWSSYPSHRRAEVLAAILREHTRDQESIKIFDTVYGGATALLRERRGLSDRFLYDLHFFHHQGEPYMEGLRHQLLESLQAESTTFIVVSHGGWRKVGKERIFEIEGVREVLAQNFELVHDGPDWSCLRRKRGESTGG